MKRLALATIALSALGTKLMMSDNAGPLPPAHAPAAAPIVLSIPAPSLVMVNEPARPPLAEPPEPPLPPAPRARSPHLDVTCLIALEGVSDLASCGWDSGFPAISADGAKIAVVLEFRGYDVQFIDVANPRKTITRQILNFDEYMAPDDPDAPAARKQIVDRIAKVQRELDRGGYRPLVWLGTKLSLDPVVPPGFRAEFVEDRARMIDTSTNTVMWERRFDVTREFEQRALSANDVVEDSPDACWPGLTYNTSLAYDPTTRMLLAQVDYIGFLDGCRPETLAYTYRLP